MPALTRTRARSKERIGGLLVLAAGALWGIIGPLMMAMDALGSTAALTGFLRMGFAFLIMLALTVARHGVQSLRIDMKSLATCALLGLLCHGIYNVFYTYAVVTTGVTTSAVLENVAPIFTAIAAYFLFSEHVTPVKAVALIIDVVGCILAVTGGRMDMTTLPLIGIGCAIAAGMCYGTTAIIGRIAGSRINVFTMSTYSYLFATVFLGLYLQPWNGGILLSPEICIVGFVLALVPTAFAYILYYRGIQLIGESGKVPIIASVETVVATLFGVIAYHESLGAVGIIGIVCVLGSIALMNRPGPFAKKRSRKRTETVYPLT